MILDNAATKKINTYPDKIREKLLRLRKLIFEVAASNPRIGTIEETLKWNEPAYLTAKTKSGITIRIDWKEKTSKRYALYVNCKTNLIEQIDTLMPNQFQFEGNRAILFNLDEEIDEEAVKCCIDLALTYHLTLISHSLLAPLFLRLYLYLCQRVIHS